LGGYRIEELIGRGGMGMVYRATNVALHRIYAIKVLDPALASDEQFQVRFRREMRIAASLNHPNVVAIHYAGEHDGLLFLSMDYVHGSDLRRMLSEHGALAPDRAVDILTQLASALDAAHRQGLVHRDVKPANVLITVRDGEERAYLTDFGLAKQLDSMSGLTATGAVLGTVDYMAPEQITGERADARTDIYALGCVFYQMLAGEVPYGRDNSIATLFAHVNDDPPRLGGHLAGLHPEFDDVIGRAMAKRPEDRYLSAGDFARDAIAALAGSRYTGAESMVATGEAQPARMDDRPSRRGDPASRGPEPLAQPFTGTQDTKPAFPQRPAGETILSPSTARSPESDRRVVERPPDPASGPRASDAELPQPPDRGGSSERAGLSPRGRYRLWAAVALVAAAIAAVVIIVASSGSSPAASGAGFQSSEGPIPTNRVTGGGTVAVALHGQTATVTLTAHGLLNGSPHVMHIHAFGAGICPSASAAQQLNGHAAISADVGDRFYGPPIVSLTTSGDTSAASHLAFDRSPSSGNISYKRTITIPAAVAKAIRDGNAVVVMHGIDYDGSGVYDNVLGHTTVNGVEVPQEATAPALCGTLHGTRTLSAAARHSPKTVFTADLHAYRPRTLAEFLALWLCSPTAD
jgi:serine/threonine protein kinase